MPHTAFAYEPLHSHDKTTPKTEKPFHRDRNGRTGSRLRRRQPTGHRPNHIPGGHRPVTVIDPDNGEIYSIRYYKRKRRERREDEEGGDH